MGGDQAQRLLGNEFHHACNAPAREHMWDTMNGAGRG
jgi:hypothetical protein